MWLLGTEVISQVREGSDDDDESTVHVNCALGVEGRARHRRLHSRMLYRHGGRTYITPMLLSVIAIGTADVMFAVDSIPAIYSLTSERTIVCRQRLLLLG